MILDSSHGSGPTTATRTSRSPGCSPGTTASSTSQGRTDGCSATATAAPTCTSSPGLTSADTRPSGKGRHPTTRACRLLGLATTQGAAADQQDHPGNSRTPRTVVARSAKAPCFPSRTGHRPHASGRHGWPPAPRSSRPQRGQATRRRLEPVSYTPNADTASARNCGTPTSQQGLLEPDAGKLARPVLRGAGRSNAPGLPGDLECIMSRSAWRGARGHR